MSAGSGDRRRGGRPERDGLARRRPGVAAPAESEPATRRPNPANARRIALDVLDATLGPTHRAFDEAFEGHPRLAKLAVRDRAFARLLVTTVLRRLGQIDRVVSPLLRFRPKEIPVENMLRLGAAQLLFLHTPAHAAVGETVRLAAGRFPKQAPLLNAVLRKLASEGAAAIEAQDAAKLNTPKWLWESWSAAHGEDTARAIATAHLGEPPLDLAVVADAERWAGELGAEILPGGTLRRRAGGLVDALPGYDEGAWWVQDAAAGLPARLLGAVKGKRVLDLCAAPGGKTAQLCAAGAEVTAVERSPTRAEMLGLNLGRLGMTADIVVADALEWQPALPFDLVLLDAPCTATGTIRRHPDIPWIKSPEDVSRLTAVQERLLRAALGFTGPGGTIVYAVCSLQPEEGEQRVAALLAEGGVEPLPVRRAELGGLEARIDTAGQVRTLPCDLATSGGLDGFFIARLRRR
ncbi:MAG TPA: RsmB/NOP family class I SAM-dependent RNA methyltransferase [Geminicoccaceae bacterium]|nr:RsmB/NOP family class I SAM-dependent RNA methyltransferase [Geminicoccus sp.]HMU51269.1 RsmB/NOP family class I SAM-dependent RNA methyltransferase [Geminicoccaceae bacterium]